MNIKGIIILILSLLAAGCQSDRSARSVNSDRIPMIFPDYKGVTVPFNIAPMNFSVNEEGEKFFITMRSNGEDLVFKYKSNKVIFPEKKWAELLKKNKGDSIEIFVRVLQNNKTISFKPFYFLISDEPVDAYIIYRRIMPGFQNWNQMGIYQRSLTDFDIKTVIDSKVLPGTCMNCHSFAHNNPDNMVLHLREREGGTIIYQNNGLKKINTKTPEMFGNAAFPSWHPSEKFIAFSVNRVNQVFHAAGTARAAAIDMKSDIFVYDIKKNLMLTTPLISATGNYETFPCFSADGNTLFYSSAAAVKLPEKFDSIRYSICKVTFDQLTGNFGSITDTLISARKTGKSYSIPRVSPDGRFILYCVADYGAFPSYNVEADLGLLDLENNKYSTLDSVNSNNVESWHSWSSNGRWIAFSSRRMDGLYSNIYLVHIDKNGVPRKPFILPQEDPDFYREFLFSFNVPEFAVKEISPGPYQIEKAAKSVYFTQVQSGSH